MGALRRACAFLAVVGLLLLGCGGGEAEPETPAVRADERALAQADEAAAEETTEARREVFEGRIVGRGPLGEGSCVQQSYEVELEGGARRWIHHEHCGAASGPTFEDLVDGQRYRFTVQRGASLNFANEPMILAAELLSGPPPPSVGYLTIPLPDHSTCDGGRFLVDGQDSGEGYPVTRFALAPGRHRVELRSANDCAGMGAYEVEIRAGREVVLE